MSSTSNTIKEYVQACTVTLRDGTVLPSLGQGTWHMGDDSGLRQQEIEALRTGLDCGMTVIDTAEMYGGGKAEELVGEAVKGRREEAFLVSKVLPNNAGGKKLEEACEGSLSRLGVDQLDLYLLHWRGSIPLKETVRDMEKLKADGKIKRWGVSNLDVRDMKELLSLEHGNNAVCDQVLYHLASRGIEFDLMPWMKEQQMPVIAYCPLDQGGGRTLGESRTLQEIAERRSMTPLQIALAWTIQSGMVLSIPKTSNPAHVRENAGAASVTLANEELEMLDRAFPKPQTKQPLDIV
ncbi:aldo/keto reductase [Marinococcus halophilus]|uniref:Aldehyde reductase n=1 Tax=Marinococcus halophilus TaxID=1371 RepID=A0A510Y9D0_MARHA|nr:aldo/keto reductase [Marinococcus halophilus]OZT79212.1 aldo/keto reductase [Marinococcus halophilus]GEK59773.1 aldehyde reductase [Marinococcus halophilus]